MKFSDVMSWPEPDEIAIVPARPARHRGHEPTTTCPGNTSGPMSHYASNKDFEHSSHLRPSAQDRINTTPGPGRLPAGEIPADSKVFASVSQRSRGSVGAWAKRLLDGHEPDLSRGLIRVRPQCRAAAPEAGYWSVWFGQNWL
jgi:hypothetical protein